ncbi:Crp/Fnr family transcriptional regulator [Sorangium atrum]|uniref:Crp/Fnr family transcriptional regulator n=1 Tax=Sorangium atrum TaxID=2995308 RepID=A0ABT5C9W5_9BACT|nr:Crp/Fnr family transcriptional regulator [Sorangium aterium]MDC0683218.1 Crp/Fnr family transcriptional regulator [Sorangium aterium]
MISSPEGDGVAPDAEREASSSSDAERAPPPAAAAEPARSRSVPAASHDEPAASSARVEPAESGPDPERLRARFGRPFEAGDVIFREGEPGTESYLLEEGRVRLIKKVRGAERSLMVLKPGDLFGESALLGGAARSSTAIALSRGVALALDQGTLQNLVERNPAVAMRIIKQLVGRLRDAEDQIEIMMLNDTQSKVVNALLKLAQQSRATGSAASFAISPMELSTRVGLDVDTVKRAVQQLREGQYLRVADERLEIPDIEALRRLFGLLGLKDEIRGEQ